MRRQSKAAAVAFIALWLLVGERSAKCQEAEADELSVIFSNEGQNAEAAVKTKAQNQANSSPKWKSTKIEAKSFKGVFIPDSDSTKLAFFSDDGVQVFIGQQNSSLMRLDEGQTLPKLDQSFRILTETFKKGVPYCIKVDYKNISYTGSGDIDGCTMFAYNGGGKIQKMPAQKLKFIYHDNAGTNNVLGTLGASSSALQRDEDGDGQLDTSCCMEFKASGDPVKDTTEGLHTIRTQAQLDNAFNILSNSQAQAYICVSLFEPGTTRRLDGRAQDFGVKRFAIRDAPGPTTVAHEWGHCKGLQHRNTNDKNLMHEYYGPVGDYINGAERAAFLP